ncbi:MAG: pyrroline-5-carboxylate reductase [Mycobacterium sp.]|nr:pyrroline-5-carboxylate reductase [Mycobacterium sp.]
MVRIAIIGGGSMGEALLAGLLRAGKSVRELVVAERAAQRAAFLNETYGVRVASIAEAAEHAGVVILAVKPGDVDPAVNEIAAVAAQAEGSAAEQVLVSVAAGVPIAYFEARLPVGSPVIRVMPNTPALVGAGVSALAKGRFATDEQLNDVAELFESVGLVHIVSESQLDAVTAVSGSGPAYIFLFVEALVDAGVAAGLSRAVATDLAVQTMAGSVTMLTDRMAADRAELAAGGAARPDTTAAQLRATVTSPGGTTAAGLRELERGGLRAAVDAAVQAAKTRSEQLGITAK